MEKAKVYFSDFRTVAFGDGLPTKLKKLIRRAGNGEIDKARNNVARQGREDRPRGDGRRCVHQPHALQGP